MDELIVLEQEGKMVDEYVQKLRKWQEKVVMRGECW